MKVALLGMGPSAHEYVRTVSSAGSARVFDELWTVNCYGSVYRADRVFHMDDVKIQEIRAAAGHKHIENTLKWLKEYDGDVYTSRAWPDYECLQEFPLEDVLTATGGPVYFNGTVAYAMALALAGVEGGLPEDVESISLFGLDYAYQMPVWKGEKGRSCVEYWLGRMHAGRKAPQNGPKVFLNKKTWLMDAAFGPSLYGYDTVAVEINAREDGSAKVEFVPIPEAEWPTAFEIEKRYLTV